MNPAEMFLISIGILVIIPVAWVAGQDKEGKGFCLSIAAGLWTSCAIVAVACLVSMIVRVITQ